MFDKIRDRDGTIIDFNPTQALGSISGMLQDKIQLNKSQALSVARNILDLVIERADGVPSMHDIDTLVQLVLMSNTSNISKDCEDVQKLLAANVELQEQAIHILNGSDTLDELGRSIFLDRYSVKGKKEDVQKGNLVITITKEDPKYPKKDLGIITNIDDDSVNMHMITGQYAGETFTQSLWKCDVPTESVADAHHRVADAIASVEKENKEYWYNQFIEQLTNKHIQPAGRIMTGANRGDGYTQNLTLYNCYVIPSPKDSRGGIVKETLYNMIEIMSRGGGVGITLSTLRPRYSYVRGVHGKSSGAVSWGGLFSYGTGLIEQGGSRRGALMLMLDDWHPDVFEFISSKRKRGMIENANISVLVSDKFMDCLANDGDWDLMFPDYERAGEAYETSWTGDIQKWVNDGYPVKVYRTVKARELWDELISSAHASAEPGVVFMERYNKMSNSWYYNPVICTNPCGEQGLPAWGVCNLGHLYLASFLKESGNDNVGPVYEFDWDALKQSSRVLARFLDNVIDATPYHNEENRINQQSERRVGGGTLGLGELLIKMRFTYGSEESINFIDRVYKTICTEMYRASVEIAKEKGMFENCDPEKYIQSGFCQQLPQDLREEIKEHGIRNVTLTTQAPTGTVGTMLSTSTGIEPYYAFEYYRQSRLGFHKVNLPLADMYQQDGNLPNFFVSAMDLEPRDHILVQAAVQRWTDSSISKTANAPENFSVQQTKELYEEAYKLGCKGVTIYRDNCRSEQVLSTDADTEKKNAASANGEEYVSEGSKCELKVDDYGQVYKSCSD